MHNVGRVVICAHCSKEFETAWSDEEANAEALPLFGIENALANPNTVELCDDCFKMMTVAYPPERYFADLADEAVAEAVAEFFVKLAVKQ